MFVQVLRDVLQNSIQPVPLLVQACHAFSMKLLCISKQNWSLNSILLSHLDTVFHCPLSCHLFNSNTNLWLQKVSPIELCFELKVFFPLGFQNTTDLNVLQIALKPNWLNLRPFSLDPNIQSLLQSCKTDICLISMFLLFIKFQ